MIIKKSHKNQCRGEVANSDLKKEKASAPAVSESPGLQGRYPGEVCREENKANKAKKNKK